MKHNIQAQRVETNNNVIERISQHVSQRQHLDEIYIGTQPVHIKVKSRVRNRDNITLQVKPNEDRSGWYATECVCVWTCVY